MKTKRVLAGMLIFCMLLTMLPLAAFAETDLLSIPNSVSWSANSLTGGTVSSTDYSSKNQVWIFFRANGICSNSNYTMRGINQSSWANRSDVQVIAIGVGEDGESIDTVRQNTQNLLNQYAPGNSNMVVCCMTLSQFWDTVRQLQREIGDGSNSVLYS